MPSFHSPSSCARCGSRKRRDPDAPKTDGRAVSARNATSHGLFARDVVLPHLGEDADAYNALLGGFLSQIAPRNLLERHYVEKIAAGTWRLRRLHRWQAQLFEDPTLDEGERLDRLDKVLRHETALHRQIDAAVKMLGKDVAPLFAARAREQALSDWDATAQDCKDTPALARQVEHQARRNQDFAPFPADGFDPTALDTKVMPSGAYTRRPAPAGDTQHENCQNETAQPDADTAGARRNAPTPPAVEPETRNCQNETDGAENCQTELPPPETNAQPSTPVPNPPIVGEASRLAERGPQRSGEVGPSCEAETASADGPSPLLRGEGWPKAGVGDDCHECGV